MALSDRLILGRRAAYLCCACDYAAVWQRSLIEGNRDCAKEYRRKALAHLWAYTVVRDYPISTETGACCSDCEDDDFVLAVINKMDPGCVNCGCGTRPLTCDITPDYSVSSLQDAAFQPNAVAGVSYLIGTNVSGWTGTWGDHVNSIVTDTTFTPVPVGKIIYDASNEIGLYWVQTQNGVGLLFPRLNGTLVGTTLTVASLYPDVHTLLNRTIVVEVSEDGVTWTAIYVGAESQFANPTPFDVTGTPAHIRTTYTYGEIEQCSQTATGAIPPPPPVPKLSFQIQNDEINGSTGTLHPAQIPVNGVTDVYQEAEWTLAFFAKGSTQGVSAFATLFSFYRASNLIELTITPGTMSLTNYGAMNKVCVGTFFDDTWRHYAIVKSGANGLDYGTGTIKIYINGVEQSLILDTNDDPIDFNNLGQVFSVMGQSFPGGAGPFTGYVRMCEVFMSNQAVSQSDIQNILMTGTVNQVGYPRTMYAQPTAADTLLPGGVNIQNPNGNTYSMIYGLTLAADNPLP